MAARKAARMDEPRALNTPPELVTMDTIIEWSFDDLRHTAEREAKLEWGAARPLSAAAKACDLVVPFAWLFERLSTARLEAARPVARAARVPRDRRTLVTRRS